MSLLSILLEQNRASELVDFGVVFEIGELLLVISRADVKGYTSIIIPFVRFYSPYIGFQAFGGLGPFRRGL